MHSGVNLATFIASTLSSEQSPAVLVELVSIKWNATGLSEVRTDEAHTMLKNRHVLCYHGLVDRKLAVGFLINKNIAGNNIEKFYSIIERVISVVIKVMKGN